MTKCQNKILRAQGIHGKSRKLVAQDIRKSRSHIHTTNTTIYQDFREALEVFNEYYPLFERRVLRDSDEVKELLLSLNRKINQGLKAKGR